MNRWNLNQTRFFEIATEYINTRNQQLLSLRLQELSAQYEPFIKQEVMTLLNELVHEVDVTDNVTDFNFQGPVFYIQEKTDEQPPS